MSSNSDLPPPLPPISMPPPIPAPAPPVAPTPREPETVAPSPKLSLAAPSVGMRDRIVIIGRRRAGKTIYLARLYEALWQGCTLIDGRVPADGEENPSGKKSKMSCRATTGAAHTQFMRVVDELKAGRWPAATVGNSYAELIVEYNGREHLLTALDYPGEVFRKAFMGDSDEPDALELLAAVDRAAAAIFLIDPAVVAAGGNESHEDTFGLTQAAARIRQGAGGEEVPIAVVFTKCDSNRALLKEAGGVRDFAKKHFGQLFKSLERTSVFASAAVRVSQNALGKVVPRADRLGENIVEPLRFCFELMQETTGRQVVRDAKKRKEDADREGERAVESERKTSTVAWTIFAIATVMLLVSVAVVTYMMVYMKK